MRSRLLSIASALALALGGMVVALLPASPASAHCSGHGTHPDRYEGGRIRYSAGGTNIRSHPHINCTAIGLGVAGQGVDVHCAVWTDTVWIYIRNLATGVNGWSRWDALNITSPTTITDCTDTGVTYTL
jgi:hypothetical protein